MLYIERLLDSWFWCFLFNEIVVWLLLLLQCLIYLWKSWSVTVASLHISTKPSDQHEAVLYPRPSSLSAWTPLSLVSVLCLTSSVMSSEVSRKDSQIISGRIVSKRKQVKCSRSPRNWTRLEIGHEIGQKPRFYLTQHFSVDDSKNYMLINICQNTHSGIQVTSHTRTLDFTQRLCWVSFNMTWCDLILHPQIESVNGSLRVW